MPGNRDRHLDPGGYAPGGADAETGFGGRAVGDRNGDRQADRTDAQRQVEADLVVLHRDADALRLYREFSAGQDVGPAVRFLQSDSVIVPLGRVERMLDLKDSSAAEDTVDAEMLAGPFLHLPSRKILPDYYKIITAPIDIGSIRQALNRTKTNNYLRVQDFIQDVELMFANAKLYNADGSKLFVAANTLR